MSKKLLQWEQKMIKEAEQNRKLEAKMTEQARQAQRAQMERSIKMRKRVILIERRVKELENTLTREFSSKFKMKDVKNNAAGSIASSLKAIQNNINVDTNVGKKGMKTIMKIASRVGLKYTWKRAFTCRSEI